MLQVIEIEENRKAVKNTETGKILVDFIKHTYTEEGAFKNKSKYFVVKTSEGEAIFDTEGNMVSQWHEQILPFGAVDGESKFYLAQRENGKWAIFHINGKRISKYFDKVFSYGLVQGEGSLYIVKDRHAYAIFNKKGEIVENWYFQKDDRHSLNVMLKKLQKKLTKRNKKTKQGKNIFRENTSNLLKQPKS